MTILALSKEIVCADTLFDLSEFLPKLVPDKFNNYGPW